MENKDRTVVPLTMLPPGVKGRVVNIGSYGKGLAMRVSNMGLDVYKRQLMEGEKIDGKDHEVGAVIWVRAYDME